MKSPSAPVNPFLQPTDRCSKLPCNLSEWWCLKTPRTGLRLQTPTSKGFFRPGMTRVSWKLSSTPSIAYLLYSSASQYAGGIPGSSCEKQKPVLRGEGCQVRTCKIFNEITKWDPTLIFWLPESVERDLYCGAISAARHVSFTCRLHQLSLWEVDFFIFSVLKI